MSVQAPIRVVLASSSSTRLALLQAAGVQVRSEPAHLNEAEVKAACLRDGLDAAACATALAESKARIVSRRHSDALVIGADQMLVCGNRWFDKPESLTEARTHLLALRGREHELVTAACVLADGGVLWRHLDRPRLVMRSFSDAFLDSYLNLAGKDAMSSVGAYRLEGLGVQLFDRVEGDLFAILGLPLLPLLGFLRSQGTVPT
jgi:nucleoside triphosphate pyrophosphatase